MQKIPITNKGRTLVENELKDLKTIQRPKVIDAIADARAHGDLSENAGITGKPSYCWRN